MDMQLLSTETVIGGVRSPCDYDETREIEMRLQEMMRELGDKGLTHEGLLALAKVLHVGLVHLDVSRVNIPRASALDMLVRAIIADMSGDDALFVMSKLELGFNELKRALVPGDQEITRDAPIVE